MEAEEGAGLPLALPPLSFSLATVLSATREDVDVDHKDSIRGSGSLATVTASRRAQSEELGMLCQGLCCCPPRHSLTTTLQGNNCLQSCNPSRRMNSVPREPQMWGLSPKSAQELPL